MRVRFFTDSSIYQPTFDAHYKVLKDNGGCLDVLRTSQGIAFVDDSLDEHYTNNLAVGQNIGLYHWIDPTISGRANADFFSRLVDMYKRAILIAGDFEQWWEWESWSACYEKHLIPPSQIVRLDPLKMFDCHAEFFDLICTRYQGLEIAEYTAAWFLNGFQKGLNTWSVAKKVRKWLAAYFNLGKGYTYMSWDQWRSTMDGLVMPQIPDGWENEWDAWQITSTVIVPGMPVIDYNIINEKSSLNKLFGGVQPQYHVFLPYVAIPQATYLYRVFVNVSWLTVCAGPGVTYPAVDWIPYNTPLDILEENVNGWGRFEKGWVNLKYTRR